MPGPGVTGDQLVRSVGRRFGFTVSDTVTLSMYIYLLTYIVQVLILFLKRKLEVRAYKYTPFFLLIGFPAQLGFAMMGVPLG